MNVLSAKNFMFLCLFVILFSIYRIMPITSTERNTLLVPPDLPDLYDFNMKYLLFWTPRSQHSPFTSMQEGVREFVKNNCEYKNCFLTANRSFFESITKFDAILFHGKELSGEKTTVTLPQSRSPKQKYIFATIESANNYPVCDAVYDGFFNWTWTYRLDSDVRWGYLTVQDMEGRVVGPKVDMSWRPMNETIDEVRGKLKTKSKAVAWMVSNCRTRSLRELYALDLRKNLSALNLELDIYGACEGLKSCPKNRAQNCNRKILNNYYFYLAFENSFSVDYVTEKVLNAMDNLVVPIVYGDANYSRFLPPGSYINAREFSPEQLADTISNLMSNSSQYEEFFRWRRFYRIVETTSNADVCNLCAAMNDHKKFMSESVYSNFREWWNDKDQECPDRRKKLVWKYTFT